MDSWELSAGIFSARQPVMDSTYSPLQNLGTWIRPRSILITAHSVALVSKRSRPSQWSALQDPDAAGGPFGQLPSYNCEECMDCLSDLYAKYMEYLDDRFNLAQFVITDLGKHFHYSGELRKEEVDDDLITLP